MPQTTISMRQGNKLLRALALYQHLTREQAAPAAGFSRNAPSYGVNTLTWLTAQGLTIKHNLPHDHKQGNAPGLWLLSEKGIAHVKELGLVGVDDIPDFLPNPSVFFREHVHAINNVLIGLVEWANTTDGVTLLDFQHDHMLKRRPIDVPIDGRIHHTSADGLIDLQINRLDQEGPYVDLYRLWLELDRATEDDKQFKRKIDLIVRFAMSVPDAPLTVMVVVNPKPPNNAHRRMLQLRLWTESHLKANNQMAWADLFRFRTIGHDEIPYGEFFTGPHWVRPFDDVLYPLIEAPEEAAD